MEAILQDRNAGWMDSWQPVMFAPSWASGIPPIAQRYQVPIVVTGFEPVDLLEGILMTVTSSRKEKYRVENQYSRVVRPEGNPAAISLLEKIFRVSHREWRGLGEIPGSGYGLRENYLQFDAEKNSASQKRRQSRTRPVAPAIS